MCSTFAANAKERNFKMYIKLLHRCVLKINHPFSSVPNMGLVIASNANAVDPRFHVPNVSASYCPKCSLGSYRPSGGRGESCRSEAATQEAEMFYMRFLKRSIVFEATQLR